jgi:hypothetical protein
VKERRSSASYRRGLELETAGIERGVGARSMVKLPVRSNGWGLKTVLTGGVHASAGKEKRGCTGSVSAYWAAGCMLDWARFAPRALLYFFFLPSSFPFLFFLFLL